MAAHAGSSDRTWSDIRNDFPLLATTVHGHPLAYLDNGATTQKPQAVIDAELRFYTSQNANIHRGVYTLSRQATAAYERARHTVQKFLNAADPVEIIFTRGTTESINLVAASWGRANLTPGDEVLISGLEHHSNIVPWQIACQLSGATLKVIPLNDRGELRMDLLPTLLTDKTRLVAIAHLSNSLGTNNDAEIKTIIPRAHAVGAKVLIDGAQWIAHQPTDVQTLDADFYAFSGHKLFGPTGVGVLYGKRALLESMPPYQSGGDMIESVTFEKTVYAELPNKFEAGTPNIAGGIGLAVAIDYVTALGFDRIAAREAELLAYATQKLNAVPGLRIIGTAAHKASVISFVMHDPPIASLDLGTRLDHAGIAVRTGHHCCQPVMDRFGITSTTRAALAFYNTTEEIDRLAIELVKIREHYLTRAPTQSTTPPPSPGIAIPGSTRDTNKNAPTLSTPPSALSPQSSPLAFPKPTASSPSAAAAKLAATFDFLGDWNDRYQYLLDLGGKLLPLPASEKTEANRVHGCQSVVHLLARENPDSPGTLDFLADSDADIVRGLIAVLQKIYAGQSAASILAFDINGFVQQIGLDQHLAMTRRNGLAGMIQKIRAFATKQLAAAAE
jgi:cysteine desulfurase/selenocysteine lyase